MTLLTLGSALPFFFFAFETISLSSFKTLTCEELAVAAVVGVSGFFSEVVAVYFF